MATNKKELVIIMHMLSRLYRYIPTVLVFMFIFAGFLLRLKGISANHSFWGDEAFLASIARDLYDKNVSFISFHTLPGVNYQSLQVITVYISFLILGTTEFAARIPSVIWGTLGILFSFVLTKKIAGEKAALITSFVYAFSQLNIANATQAKPYAAQQTLLLIFVYILYTFRTGSIKKDIWKHTIIATILVVSTLYHILGITYWIVYFIWFSLAYQKVLLNRLRDIRFLGILGVIAFVILIPLTGAELIGRFLTPVNGAYIIVANNLIFAKDLFIKQYGFITIPALFGIFMVFRTKKTITLPVLIYIGFIVFLWTFRQPYHNIRYLVPVFGLLIVFFGVFWGNVFEMFWKKKSWIMTLILIGIIFLSGYKIVRKPVTYYNPNADFYGDVQIGNYKKAYEFINEKYANQKDIVLFNDVYDSEHWYSMKKSTAIFQKFVDKPRYDMLYKITIYGSLSDFKREMKKYNKGLLVVEDWESLLPEDIKQYAKKNMKREFRVEGIPQANGDNWPVEIYSWGL